jgi:site-specific DNA recombinase
MQNQENLHDFKVANYNRKSQESDDKQALSIPSQIEEAAKLASRYGIKDLEVYQESKSAKTPGQRKEFDRMIKEIKSGRRNTILCWKLDRLARNMEEGGQIIDLLQRGIIKAIITPIKIFWPIENALYMALEFGSSNQFSRDLSVNVKRGQTKKAKMGYPHGVAAIGFKNDKTEEKGNRKWMVDPERLPLVREMFKKYLSSNWSVNKLARYVRDELKLTTPVHKKIGGCLVWPARVHEMLKDPIYAGYFYYGDPKDRYELNPSLPRVITEEEHYRILKRMKDKNIPKVKTHITTYSGFVRSPEGEFVGQDVKYQVICDCKKKFGCNNNRMCPKCGTDIDDMKNPTNIQYVYHYNVPRKKRGEVVKGVEEKEVTKYLLSYLGENLQFSKAFAEWSKKFIRELKDREIEESMTILESKRQRKEEAIKMKKRVLDLQVMGQISADEASQKKEELDTVIHQQEITEMVDWEAKANEIIDLNVEITETLTNGTIMEKRELLTKLGSNLTWNEEKLNVFNRISIQTLIDGLKNARSKKPQFEPRNIVDTSDSNEVFASVRTDLLPR